MTDKLTDPLEQIENTDNVQKYKDAGLIATKAVTQIVKNAKPGSNLLTLITKANELIKNELSGVHKDVKDKGILFPICLSLNHVAGYNIPTNQETLKEGDLLKIDLGVHIDGFPAQIAFTTLVTNNQDVTNVIKDKRANVMRAVIEASREIGKIMTPGTMNTEIVKIMEQTAKKYGCSLPISNENGLIPGVNSFQISRYVIDGYTDDDCEFVHRFILARENTAYDFSLMELPLEENEVYAIDIVMCSGTGKLNQNKETSIFKRNYERRCELKLKASKNVLNSLKGSYPIVIDIQDPKVKMGIKECVQKGLVNAYPVVAEKDGEFTARIKFTIIVKDKPVLICGKQADQELMKLEKI